MHIIVYYEIFNMQVENVTVIHNTYRKKNTYYILRQKSLHGVLQSV